MHIEPGLIAPVKLSLAAATAALVYLLVLPRWLRQPRLWIRTALAAVFFSMFMQAFHMQVGPSELHFIGAMPVYLSFGYLPAMLGFGIGLFLQALIFEPQDMVHLAVNTLSLVIPLTLVHWRFGKQTAELNWQRILKLDAVYYSGVTLMVAFWLSMAEVATPFSAWLQFAASYLLVVAAEPVMTQALLSVFRVLRQRPQLPRWMRVCLDEGRWSARV